MKLKTVKKKLHLNLRMDKIRTKTPLQIIKIQKEKYFQAQKILP